MDADDADDGIVEARGGSSVRRQSLEETALELRSRASTWTLLLLTLMVFGTVVAACGAAAGANKSCENALADLAHGAFPRRGLLFRRRGRTPQAASGSAPSPSRATRRSST